MSQTETNSNAWTRAIFCNNNTRIAWNNLYWCAWCVLSRTLLWAQVHWYGWSRYCRFCNWCRTLIDHYFITTCKYVFFKYLFVLPFAGWAPNASLKLMWYRTSCDHGVGSAKEKWKPPCSRGQMCMTSSCAGNHFFCDPTCPQRAFRNHHQRLTIQGLYF